jgi:hypothetical protein
MIPTDMPRLLWWQGLSPQRPGFVARSDSSQPDRGAFGHVPTVGRTRTATQYAGDDMTF